MVEVIETFGHEDVSHGRTWRQRGIELGDGWEAGPSGILLPAASREPRERPVAVDLFAGAGGFGLGFHQAGFHVAVASEADHSAACTYLVNLGARDTLVHVLPAVDEHTTKAAKKFHDTFEGESMTAVEFFAAIGCESAPGSGWISTKRDHDPDACPDCDGDESWCETYHAAPDHTDACEHYYLGDVFALKGDRILSDLGMSQGDIDAVTGGPPCQGFSHAGKRNVHDPRNSLVFEFARLVLELQPKTFVMENVPGILSMKTPEGVPVIDALTRVISDGGFGPYDALRKALKDQAERALALHRMPMEERKDVDEDDDDVEVEDVPAQLGLLDAA